MSLDAAFDDADLNGFVDGRIEPARAAALAESLASDPEARARIDGWKRQNESLRTMFASVLFEPVPVRLLPVAAPPSPTTDVAGPLRDVGRTTGRIGGVLATTSIGMALVGFALGALASTGTDGFGLAPSAIRDSGLGEIRREGGGATGRGLAERAAEAHRTFLGDTLRPVEMTAAEEPKLLRWLRHRLGAALRIPDLGRQGWTLIGGRIVPGGRSGPAAFLVYGNGAARLGLTMSRAPDRVPDAIVTPDGGEPIAVATWSGDDFSYALTTDQGADWLERNAAPLRDSMRAQAFRQGSNTPP